MRLLSIVVLRGKGARFPNLFGFLKVRVVQIGEVGKDAPEVGQGRIRFGRGWYGERVGIDRRGARFPDSFDVLEVLVGEVGYVGAVGVDAQGERRWGFGSGGGGTGISLPQGLPRRVMITSSPLSRLRRMALAWALSSRML